jgi:hypothetical protein
VTALRIAGGRVVAPGGVLDGADMLWDGTGVRGRPRAVLRNGEVVA